MLNVATDGDYNLKILNDEASQLLGKCDEQIENLLHDIKRYEEVKNELQNGRKLIEFSLNWYSVDIEISIHWDDISAS